MQSTDPFSSTRQQKRDLGPRADGIRGTFLPPPPLSSIQKRQQKQEYTIFYSSTPIFVIIEHRYIQSVTIVPPPPSVVPVEPEGRTYIWTVVKYGTTDDKPNRVVYPAERNI